VSKCGHLVQGWWKLFGISWRAGADADIENCFMKRLGTLESKDGGM
jgi:hypothetical protein